MNGKFTSGTRAVPKEGVYCSALHHLVNIYPLKVLVFGIELLRLYSEMMERI